jgi:hypothetical protein
MAAVGGCCLCVYDWSVIGLQCVIHLGSKNYPMIHSFSNCSHDPFPGFYHFGMLFNFFKTSILQTLLATSNPTYLVTNCKYGHFIFLIPFRSYTMAEWQNISISHAGYTYAIFIFYFTKLLYVSSKPLHLELSFRCTILSSAMVHHPFFIKFFRHYSCGTSSRAIQLGKIFLLLFGMDSVWMDTFSSFDDSRRCCNRPLTPGIYNKHKLRSLRPKFIQNCYRSMVPS